MRKTVRTKAKAPQAATNGSAAPAAQPDESIDFVNQMSNAWLDAQILPLQWIAQSQAAWVSWQNELWDEWSAHFGGGVPIDA